MDPLFGFIDDLTVQHQVENSGGVGEYTISYPADQSEHYQLEASNSQIGNTVDSSSGQVVHVVSENSQNEKQIYVIKLDNFLKDDGSTGGTTVKFEGADADFIEQANYIMSNQENLRESSSGSSDEDNNDKPHLDDKFDPGAGPDPFLVIAPEAVMAMAQSVGVDLNEEDASELGCIAINKLRHAILIAMQFSQNENSEGITVENFAKAEEQLGCIGVGQESVFRETAFKYGGGVSIIDDGPEVDLHSSVQQQNISQFSVDNIDPVLNVHHVRTSDPINENNEGVNLKKYDEFVAECCTETESTDLELKELKVEHNIVKVERGIVKVEQTSPSVVDAETALLPYSAIDSETSENVNEPHYPVIADDSSDDDARSDTFKGLINDFEDTADHDPVELNSDESQKDDTFCSDGIKHTELAPEWNTYFQVLMEQVMADDCDGTTSFVIRTTFRRILRDIRKNGLHPTVPMLCDIFRDYLRQSPLSELALLNMLYVVDALISSKSPPTFAHMTDLGCLLIEIIILPPPCPIHQFLTQVFMKIMKNCNELLTWTCTYITELLKGISDTAYEQITDPFKSTMHGALCLANGLEELNIQVAQEFGWHSSVLNFSTSHSSIYDGQSCTPSSHDSFLEEEILKFFYNFVKNYTSLVSPLELSRVNECMTTMYGERFLSFTPTVSSITPVSINKTIPGISRMKTGNKKTCCVFRKITYKDKEITVPYRKVVTRTFL